MSRGQIAVERVEMEDWSKGYAEEAEPIWRIVLNGYCADFPSEGAARNFAAQIAALSPPPTVGAEDEASGYCTDCESKTTTANGRCSCGSGRVIALPATRPSPSAVDVKGDVIAKIRKVAADFDAYAKAYDEAGLKDLALIATAKAFGVSCALEMLCPKPVSCIASEKGGA